MPIPLDILQETRERYTRIASSFSIDEIRKADKLIDTYLRLVSESKESDLQSMEMEAHRKLEQVAAKMLATEFRKFEQTVWDVYQEFSYVPSVDNDAELRKLFQECLGKMVSEMSTNITSVTKYKEMPGFFSSLGSAHTETNKEAEIYIALRGELLRLENESQQNPSELARTGVSQVQLENFLLRHFSVIHHPLNLDAQPLGLPHELLQKAIRLLTYVIFREVKNEVRLKGFEEKFMATFTRYLVCQRLTTGPLSSVAEQLCGLLEPFLKKYVFVFCPAKMQQGKTSPLWHGTLDQLLPQLGITTARIKESDAGYWKQQNPEDAVLREAYKGRHKGSHEAYTRTLAESEALVHCALGAILVCCIRLVQSDKSAAEVVEQQSIADSIRNLFPIIREVGSDPPPKKGRTVPTRLEKLQEVCDRAEAIWPTCSETLYDLMSREYGKLREEQQEADIQSHLDAMAEDEYSDIR